MLAYSARNTGETVYHARKQILLFDEAPFACALAQLLSFLERQRI
jgi:hypothetical protein